MKRSIRALSAEWCELLEGRQLLAAVSYRGSYPGGFQGGDNLSKYFLTSSVTTAFGGQDIAARLGGAVATVNSGGENAFVSGFSGGSMWIGLDVIHHAGSPPTYDLRWDTGQPVGYTNWAFPSEPNNLGGNESRVAINEHRPGAWNDLNRTWTYLTAIEVELGSSRFNQPIFFQSAGEVHVSGTSGLPVNVIALDENLTAIGSGLPVLSADGWTSTVASAGQAAWVVAIESNHPGASDIVPVQPNPLQLVSVNDADPNNPVVTFTSTAAFTSGAWLFNGASHSLGAINLGVNTFTVNDVNQYGAGSHSIVVRGILGTATVDAELTYDRSFSAQRQVAKTRAVYGAAEGYGLRSLTTTIVADVYLNNWTIPGATWHSFVGEARVLLSSTIPANSPPVVRTVGRVTLRANAFEHSGYRPTAEIQGTGSQFWGAVFKGVVDSFGKNGSSNITADVSLFTSDAGAGGSFAWFVYGASPKLVISAARSGVGGRALEAQRFGHGLFNEEQQLAELL